MKLTIPALPQIALAFGGLIAGLSLAHHDAIGYGLGFLVIFAGAVWLRCIEDDANGGAS